MITQWEDGNEEEEEVQNPAEPRRRPPEEQAGTPAPPGQQGALPTAEPSRSGDGAARPPW